MASFYFGLQLKFQGIKFIFGTQYIEVVDNFIAHYFVKKDEIAPVRAIMAVNYAKHTSLELYITHLLLL